MAQHVTVSVSPVVVAPDSSPSILLRAVYFVLVGWWLGLAVSVLAWFLILMVVGLPFGLWLLNRLPAVITLRSQEESWHVRDGVLRKGQLQHPFPTRAAYFVFVGWWFSGLWLFVAYLGLVTIVLMPVSFWMYERAGAVTTLYRS